jgi:ribulose-5-phosphate 4-epimerase/fuculose-1-phosphate aldolase
VRAVLIPAFQNEVTMSANPRSVSLSHAQARVDLAACYRLADHFGLNEGIDNHMTMLVPGHSDRFLLAPFGLHWSEVRASDFMVVDFSGQIVSGRGPIEDTALYIHVPVHRSSPKARCVLHTHMPYATALSMLENPRLEMAVQSALGFHEEVAYDLEYNGLAFDETEGERLARALGDKSVLLMGNHGALVAGQSIPQAFERLYFFERACHAQVLALSTGRALKLVPEKVVRTTAAQFESGGQVGGRDRADLHFEALKRVLDRKHADYAS